MQNRLSLRLLAALLLLLTAAACNEPAPTDPDVPGGPDSDGGSAPPAYRAWTAGA